MKYLLDTSVVIWWAEDDPRLGKDLAEQLDDRSNIVLVSAATIWEIEVKVAKGALKVPGEFLDVIRSQFELMDITADHAIAAGRLNRHHNDPFDRMLVAQARAEQAVLVTSDRQLDAYDVAIQMVD